MSVVWQCLARLDTLTAFIVAAISLFVLYLVNRSKEHPSRSSTSDSEDEQSSVEETESDQLLEEAVLPQIKYDFNRIDRERMIAESEQFYVQMNQRRSVRMFSDQSVPIQVIENVIRTAGTAPSGAHMQPWTFAVVTGADIKYSIRQVVEREEQINYERRMDAQWVDDVTKLNVNWIKQYLEQAPVLIVVLKQTHSTRPDGTRQEHYYNEISTSISVGFLLAALQMAGLVTVTTTPLNAGVAIRKILGRPANEKVLLLLPVGYPADDATVPDLKRKTLDQIMVYYGPN